MVLCSYDKRAGALEICGVVCTATYNRREVYRSREERERAMRTAVRRLTVTAAIHHHARYRSISRALPTLIAWTT